MGKHEHESHEKHEIARLKHENRELLDAVAMQAVGSGAVTLVREAAYKYGIRTRDQALKLVEEAMERRFRENQKLVLAGHWG